MPEEVVTHISEVGKEWFILQSEEFWAFEPGGRERERERERERDGRREGGGKRERNEEEKWGMQYENVEQAMKNTKMLGQKFSEVHRCTLSGHRQRMDTKTDKNRNKQAHCRCGLLFKHGVVIGVTVHFVQTSLHQDEDLGAAVLCKKSTTSTKKNNCEYRN